MTKDQEIAALRQALTKVLADRDYLEAELAKARGDGEIGVVAHADRRGARREQTHLTRKGSTLTKDMLGRLDKGRVSKQAKEKKTEIGIVREAARGKRVVS